MWQIATLLVSVPSYNAVCKGFQGYVRFGTLPLDLPFEFAKNLTKSCFLLYNLGQFLRVFNYYIGFAGVY
jgi:hypothetical protein